MNPHAERLRGLKNGRNFQRTIPTPPDESNPTGQIFFESRMIPTPPDESDHMHPSFNPKVPGSKPKRPTSTRSVRVSSDPGNSNGPSTDDKPETLPIVDGGFDFD